MSHAATPEAPVVVSFATINDGLVLRWYADEGSYAAGDEVASASRERAWFAPGPVSRELRIVVEHVHKVLRERVYGRPFARADEVEYAAARGLATHRTKHLFSDELVLIDRTEDYRQEG